MNNVIELHPAPAIWKPTADQLRAIRAYCARVEGRKPGQIVIELGERYNVDDPRVETSMNIQLVTLADAMNPDWGWDDTDLNQTCQWSLFRDHGVELSREGEALIDFYIYEKTFDDYHGELLGNAQVYYRDGRITGFSATCHPFEPASI